MQGSRHVWLFEFAAAKSACKDGCRTEMRRDIGVYVWIEVGDDISDIIKIMLLEQHWFTGDRMKHMYLFTSRPILQITLAASGPGMVLLSDATVMNLCC